jgi:hypothetical protein
MGAANSPLTIARLDQQMCIYKLVDRLSHMGQYSEHTILLFKGDIWVDR